MLSEIMAALSIIMEFFIIYSIIAVLCLPIFNKIDGNKLLTITISVIIFIIALIFTGVIAYPDGNNHSCGYVGLWGYECAD